MHRTSIAPKYYSIINQRVNMRKVLKVWMSSTWDNLLII